MTQVVWISLECCHFVVVMPDLVSSFSVAFILFSRDTETLSIVEKGIHASMFLGCFL